MNGNDSITTHNTPKIEISVRNFGPIAEADLDLRPLTVFVGPSNTGKTYLSVLIYALHRVFEDFSEFPSLHILPLLAHGLKYDDSAEEELSEVFNILSGEQPLRGILSGEQPLRISHLPKKVRDQLQHSLKDLEIYGSDLEKELKRCFDLASVSGLMRSPGNQNDETIVSLIASDVNQDLWHFKAEAFEAGVVAEGEINEKAVISPQDPSSYEVKIDHKGTFALTFESHGSIGKPYYLPAARSGIMQSHRVIASSLVARSTRAGLEPFPEVPTLSGVVADFMQQIILYGERKRPDDGMNRIADALESDVLAGQVIMNPSSTGYPEFLYRPQETGQDMRLTRSSSMVSELAPFVLFLRGLVRSGDTLIIEEPEAHLHPAAQAEMAATLARLVRAGVRVLVTTHSDFMLQEIGNLMRVGMLKEKDALKKETNDWLLPEEVGAWHFQKDQPVKEIRFDPTVGIEPEDYEDVAESLYNRWAGLQNRIEELKDESERECE